MPAPLIAVAAPVVKSAIGAFVGNKIYEHLTQPEQPSPQQSAQIAVGSSMPAMAGGGAMGAAHAWANQHGLTGQNAASAAGATIANLRDSVSAGANSLTGQQQGNTGIQAFSSGMTALPTSGFERDDRGTDRGSLFQTFLAGVAGAGSGWAIKQKDYRDSLPKDAQGNPIGATFKDSVLAGVQGALAGGLSGMLTKASYDAVQEKGGRFTAGITGGLAGALNSTLQKDGPNAWNSFLMGAGTGMVSDLVHDKATEAGHTAFADLASSTGLGAMTGHTITGSKLGTLLGAGAGGIAGGVENMLYQNNQVDNTFDAGAASPAPSNDVQYGG